MALEEGPFKQLTGAWSFTQLGDIGSKVELDVQFSFSSRLLEKSVGPVFSHVCSSLVGAFTARADALYR